MINRIMERLREKVKYNSEQAEIWREGADKDAYFREKKDLYLDRVNTYGEAIEIVQEVAKEYEDKEEQGVLIELPCKEGDTVYIIVGKDILEQRVLGYKISSSDGIEIYTLKRILYVSDFGKTVFLTRSEAKEALTKMGGK